MNAKCKERKNRVGSMIGLEVQVSQIEDRFVCSALPSGEVFGVRYNTLIVLKVVKLGL